MTGSRSHADARASDYQSYADRLRLLLDAVAADGLDPHLTSVTEALDGQAAAELRNLIHLDVRRELGAFFTTSSLRRRALEMPAVIPEPEVVFDPACGAGDLLVEAALRLPLSDDYMTTVRHWGEHLQGCDLVPEFVRTAKLRLLLAAAQRLGSAPKIPGRWDPFPGIVVGDGLNQSHRLRQVSHIVVNPPFGHVVAPHDLGWATGRVSAAAVFLARLIEAAPVGVSITAILPDVLRSGSRYQRWRSHLGRRLSNASVELHGGFDRFTDVDVFLLKGVISDGSSGVQWGAKQAGAVVGDYFDVHVGSVVPHRDSGKGKWYPYIWPRRLPDSGSFDPAGKYRRHTGRAFHPPFVAIRRTSRPEQSGRASGVVVLGDRPVVVENHLIVALPKDGRKGSCQRLADLLEEEVSRTWLNTRIRTRHLTVDSIRELPWAGEGEHG